MINQADSLHGFSLFKMNSPKEIQKRPKGRFCRTKLNRRLTDYHTNGDYHASSKAFVWG